MSRRSCLGQALLEITLALPILLILILGAYAAARTAFLHSRAASASFAEVLRAGRNLRGIEKDLSRSVLEEGESVSVRAAGQDETGLFPILPFAPAGKTSGVAELRKSWSELGAPPWLPPASIRRGSAFHVDCWNADTDSGKRIRGWILGSVALGAIR